MSKETCNAHVLKRAQVKRICIHPFAQHCSDRPFSNLLVYQLVKVASKVQASPSAHNLFRAEQQQPQVAAITSLPAFIPTPECVSMAASLASMQVYRRAVATSSKKKRSSYCRSCC